MGGQSGVKPWVFKKCLDSKAFRAFAEAGHFTIKYSSSLHDGMDNLAVVGHKASKIHRFSK